MSLGVAIFASVVLVLAVYHKGFRKVVLCTFALALLAVAIYFGYDRYSTWHADREAQKQKAAIEKGVTACMLRLGTPAPTTGTTPDGRSSQLQGLPAGAIVEPLPTGGAYGMTMEDSFVYFANLTACRAYPDLDMATRMAPGFEGGTLPPGYLLDLKGKVVPIPPGAASPTINLPPGYRLESPATSTAPRLGTVRIPPGATGPGVGIYLPPAPPVGSVPKPEKEANVGLDATITCDVIVYDRDMFAGGDPEAIASVHMGETVQYIGHVTVGDQEIIRIHGRKGYVSGCVDVKN